jgi:hypothetical protein
MRAPGGNLANADTKHSTAIVAPPGDDGKLLATLRARAALAGITLYESTDDRDDRTYVVSRWALTRQLDSLDAVAAWLDQVTGARA